LLSKSFRRLWLPIRLRARAPVAPGAGSVAQLRFNQFDFIHGDLELLDFTAVLVGLGHAYDLDSAAAEVSAVLDDFTLDVPLADRKIRVRAILCASSRR